MKLFFLNYHYDSASVHARPEPLVGYGNGDADDPALTPMQLSDVANAMRGRDVLLITHGFNVGYAQGARSLTRFAARLALPDNAFVVAVLWPGDFYSLGVNYPAASIGAIDAGRSLGDLCNTKFGLANSFSFLSHSLGARVILEASARCARKARLLCILAGAVNADCLGDQYAAAAKNAFVTRNLASEKDMVLRVMFRIGDPLSQLLDNLPGHLGTDDHPLFEQAIGQDGPRPAQAEPPVFASQIDNADDYGHGDYLAPSGIGYVAPVAPAKPDKWFNVAAFASTAFAGNTFTWPAKPNAPKPSPWFSAFEQWRWPTG